MTLNDMGLPPYARRLDVPATRAAFAAGTLSTVRDHPTAVDEEGLVETGDADRYDPNVVTSEHVRQSRLRLWQAQR